MSIEFQLSSSNFELSEESRQGLEQVSNEQWKHAANNLIHCKKKEVTILKLYFCCMQSSIDISNDQAFLK